MKKKLKKINIKKFLKSNIKTIAAFVIGLLISGGAVYASLASSQVIFSPPSGMSSTNVQSAIEELYTKASNMALKACPVTTELAVNTTMTIFANSQEVCISRNNELSCFKINNYNIEKNHIQQVFSDGSCNTYWGSYEEFHCDASDFSCELIANGDVYCSDSEANSSHFYPGCYVDSEGYVDCW